MTQTKAEEIQARDYIPTSNTEAGRRMLANRPSDVPGYGQFMGFMLDVISRKIEPVNLSPVVPDDVSAHPNITFQTRGDRTLELDLFVPKRTDRPVPLVVAIHGGCWMAGARQEMRFYAIELAQRGYAMASVDYRLSEEATYPAAVEDCRAAIQWLKDHAASYNIDPDRIALLGGSAGGHLVELLGYSATTATQAHPQGPGPKVNAVVALYGWSDLTDPTVKDFYWNELFFGMKYEADPKLYREASPVTHVSKASPATLLLHGTIDTIVPISQAEKLVKELEANNVPYVYAPFKGGYHGYDLFKNTSPGVLYLIEEFLAEYLAK
jgi:acetyl esterase/lipase